MINIFLHHRDLRLRDSTSLIAQQKAQGNSTNIFIFTPEQINQKKNSYYNSNAVEFMIESLIELADEIKQLGGKMYFFYGDTLTIIKSIHKIIPINSLAYNLDLTPYARKRDSQLKIYCEKNLIKLFEYPDYNLYPLMSKSILKTDQTAYKMFSPFFKHCKENLSIQTISSFKNFKFKKFSSLEKLSSRLKLSQLRDFYSPNPNIQIKLLAGRKAGLKILSKIKSYLNYNLEHNSLSYESTNLGPHLHFTTLSIRECYYKFVRILGPTNDLIKQLIWRDFYSNLVWNYPELLQKQISPKENIPFNIKYQKIKWNSNAELFSAWANGMLGIPIVDAGMRELNLRGKMPNRMRLICSSTLTKLLLIDWHLGEKYFAQKLIDYDPINNIGNWLWVLGAVDSSQFIRIFSPKAQAKAYDPDALYIKKFIPELFEVKANHLHDWEKYQILYPHIINNNLYPKAKISYQTKRQLALKTYGNLTKSIIK